MAASLKAPDLFASFPRRAINAKWWPLVLNIGAESIEDERLLVAVSCPSISLNFCWLNVCYWEKRTVRIKAGSIV